MDILILILCTCFILSKLFKILGNVNTEDMKKRYKVNIISELLNEQSQQVLREVELVEESEFEQQLSSDMKKSIYNIKQYNPHFNIEKFVINAKKAYIMLSESIKDNNLATLQFLLDKEIYDNYYKYKDFIIHSTDIRKINIINIINYGDRAVITLNFITDRDNHEITFSKYMTQQNSQWLVTKIK
jgi:hypothetical protein